MEVGNDDAGKKCWKEDREVGVIGEGAEGKNATEGNIWDKGRRKGMPQIEALWGKGQRKGMPQMEEYGARDRGRECHR